jgi:transcriptional regulator with XRE-family HTH domain
MPFNVRLRHEAFTKSVALARFQSDYALAQAMEVNRSTVARVLSGELRPGAAFIAGALTALSPLEFTDLFEVVHTDRRPKQA